MNHFFNIQESILDSNEPTLHTKTIKITNTSSHFINNLKLTIDTSNPLILEQAIVRERGTLHYAGDTCFFEVGNLAPQESALLEYKSTNSTISLIEHLTLLFTPENTTSEITETPNAN